jgi:TolA-binding protein
MTPWLIFKAIFVVLIVFGGIGWVVWRSIKKSDDRKEAIVRWTVTVILVVGGLAAIMHFGGDGDAAGQIVALMAGLVFGLSLALIWVPQITGKVGDWFASLYTGGDTPPDPTPFYSIAQAWRKKGRFEEAIVEIHKQLQRFPTDVTGHMLLAEIQAEDLKDLSSAQLTLEGFCSQLGHPAPHIAEAMNRLADWQLRLAQNQEAARLALQRITELLPDTEQAQVAAQRLARLGDDRALQAVRERKPIQLRAGVNNLGLMKDASALRKPEEDFQEAARQLVAHLTEHPLDAEAREKLAITYAERYERLDLAAEQLNELAESPNHPPKEIARWLNLLADLQLKFGADYETIRNTLQRIVDRFPGLAPAELAQQRIEHLRLELKGKEKGSVVKLGTYEQNIGLKGRKSPAK